jgi:hypothetical protein
MVVKDFVLFTVGIGGIVWQALTAVNLVLLGVFMLMAGIPGSMNLPMLVRGLSTSSPQLPSATPASSTDSGKSSNGEAL